jgi:hypothetical protein
MRSDARVSTGDARRVGTYRRRLADVAAYELHAGESIVALLPFATVPKRPRGPEGKVRVGIRQSWRRYRPLVVTDRRLLVFDSGRTPQPRGLLAAFSLEDVSMGPVNDGRFGSWTFELSLAAEGTVPFDTGRHERDDVSILRRAVATAR